jgi:hypothetical protein
MKVTVDVDCTPEEARRFMGLPDLAPVHEAYVGKMRKMMEEGLTQDAMTEMMKGWAPMSEAGLNIWSGMLDQMSGKK